MVRHLHDGARGSSTRATTFRRKLTTSHKSSSRMVILPTSFANPRTQETVDSRSHDEGQEKGLLVVMPYTAGMSEDIR